MVSNKSHTRPITHFTQLTRFLKKHRVQLHKLLDLEKIPSEHITWTTRFTQLPNTLAGHTIYTFSKKTFETDPVRGLHNAQRTQSVFSFTKTFLIDLLHG